MGNYDIIKIEDSAYYKDLYKIKCLDFTSKLRKYKLERVDGLDRAISISSIIFDINHKSLTFRNNNYYKENVISKRPSEIIVYLTREEYKKYKEMPTYDILQTRHKDVTGRGKIYYWTNNKFIHRDEDLPAVVGDGEFPHKSDPNTYEKAYLREWYVNGERHRDGDMPARICKRGTIKKITWYNKNLKDRANDIAKFTIRGNKIRTYYYHNGISWCSKHGQRYAHISEVNLVNSYFTQD